MTSRASASLGPRSQRDYTSGGLTRNIWLLAVPMVLEMGLVSLFRVADMFWVGKLGPEALAAITIGENVRWALGGMAMGQGIGGLAVVARRIGEKDERAANHATLQAVLLALGISSLICMIGFALSEQLLLLLGTEPQVMPNVVSYGLGLLVEPFLIFGWGPLPVLGVAGAALALVGSQWVGFLPQPTVQAIPQTLE